MRAGQDALAGVDAEATFASAADEWRGLDLLFPLAITQISAAALLPAGSARAVAAEREAREVLHHLGADALIARLDSLLEARPAATVRAGRGDAARSPEAERTPSLEA